MRGKNSLTLLTRLKTVLEKDGQTDLLGKMSLLKMPPPPVSMWRTGLEFPENLRKWRLVRSLQQSSV
jgi:hypothetical protein